MPEMTPAGGGPAQQAPFGTSPAAGPTPNRGYEAAAAQRLGVILKQLEQLLPLAGSGSELGKDVLKMINMASKHVPAGAVTPAAERNNIQRMATQNTQNQQLMQQARQGAAGGGQAQPPGMAAA
jgi:hypothetical protein